MAVQAAHSPFVRHQDRSFWGRRRWRLHEIIEVGSRADWPSFVFDTFIILLILANVIVFSASTITPVAFRYSREIEAFNLFSVAVFTLEYAARLWVCVDLPPYRHLPHWKARLRHARTPLLIIDLLAILPFYLGNLVGLDLRVLRVFRLLRFLKITRYSPALQTLIEVLRGEARALFGAVIIGVTLLLTAASLMHFIEREVQPEAFGSVPASMWWSIATLTTIGFGDVVPVTPLGKIVGGFFMVFGLGLYALPIGIISSGFARAISRREFVITWNMVAKVPLFSRLGAKEVANIMELLQSHRFSAGEIIMRPGDPAEAMYFIASGEVRVEVGDKPSIILREGDHFGEMALLEQRERRVAVVAVSDTHLLQLDAGDFEHLRTKHPALAEHIAQVAEERSRVTMRSADPVEPEEAPKIPDVPPNLG